MVKLDCEIYAPGKRAATTEKQYEAIKNCELTGLDLLVREMVQNSLDAAINEDKTKAVTVGFIKGKFDIAAFAKCLGKDRKLFSGTSYTKYLLDYARKKDLPDRYLAIRDVGCVGLDGDVADKRSRAWKLPFGFFDGQRADSTTGGANGVGKVIAFRFGVGFVAYYSKTRDGQSRFVIAYMLNGAHSIFPRKVMPDGAAWWGRKSRNRQLGVVCVEKEPEILELLDIFKIKPYVKGRSGTTTIIPFFDEQTYHQEVKDQFPVEYCRWVCDFDSYLRFCFNQWYAPRIRGDITVCDPERIGEVVPYHWGRGLKPLLSVRNEDAQAAKVFSLIRELYDVAVGEKKPANGIKRITCPMRRNAPKYGITFHGENIGWVAVKKINYKTGDYAGVLPVLCSLVPGRVDDDGGESFIGRLGARRGFMLYCRRHGMIISYERDWDEICYAALPKPQDGEFYIGIFVVDSESTIKSPAIQNEDHTASIDVIFRSFEKTDHYGWPRRASYGRLPIVAPLLKQIKAKLAAEFRGGMESLEREPLDQLSALLGRFVSSCGTGFGDGPNPSPDGVGGVPGIVTSGNVHEGGLGGAGGRGDGSVLGGGIVAGRGDGNVRFTQGSPVYELVNHCTVVSIPVTICFSKKSLRASIRCGIAQDGSNAILDASDFSVEECPVLLIGGVAQSDDDQVVVSSDEASLTISVEASKKTDVTIVCQYELLRKDTALVLDCRSM